MYIKYMEGSKLCQPVRYMFTALHCVNRSECIFTTTWLVRYLPINLDNGIRLMSDLDRVALAYEVLFY